MATERAVVYQLSQLVPSCGAAATGDRTGSAPQACRMRCTVEESELLPLRPLSNGSIPLPHVPRRRIEAMLAATSQHDSLEQPLHTATTAALGSAHRIIHLPRGNLAV